MSDTNMFDGGHAGPPVMTAEQKYVTGVVLPKEDPIGIQAKDALAVPDTYTLANGVKLKLKPVEAMKIKMVQDGFKMPEAPTYTTVSPSGKGQTYKHDEVSAAESGPQEAARYASYLQEYRKVLEDQNLRVTRAIMFYGTELLTPLPDDGWDEMQRLNGIDVPEHKEMKRAHYLCTEISNVDLQVLLRLIMAKSGVTEEEIASVEAMFRGEVST